MTARATRAQNTKPATAPPPAAAKRRPGTRGAGKAEPKPPRAKAKAKSAKGPAKSAPAKPPARGWPTPTADAVRAELRELEKRARGISKGAVAATALAIANKLDDPETSASAAATCGRVILGALEQLRAQAPPAGKQAPIDKLRARRNASRARTSAT